MEYADEFRRCLMEMDISGLRKLWAYKMPHLDQIKTHKEGLITLHMASAECKTMPIKMRQYSDRWLRERGFGSGMPDEIKPKGWKVRW